MSRARQFTYSLEVRRKIAQEAIKGELTQIEIADKYDLTPWTVGRWKKDFIEGKMKPDLEPLTIAERQADYRERRAEREAKLRDTQEKAREAFSDVLAALVGAVSSYENFAGNSKRPGVRDALYSTRLRDYHNAIERAQKAYSELFEK
jgi:transposase-like protein